jgi:hypothetical protein
MKILGIEVEPATPEQIKKQREHIATNPTKRGPRQAASLDHLRDEVRRINELGKPNAN